MAALNLTVSKILAAWRDYPAYRRSLKSVQPGPPIFLTGTHRSGTTWAAKMLAVAGLWYVHEPFNPNKGLWPEAFSYYGRNGSYKDVDRLLKRVLSGGHRRAVNYEWNEHPLMPVRLFPPPKSRRTLIKDPLACYLVDHIARTYGFKMIALFRHPAAFCSSIKNLGWPISPFLRQFLANEALMEEHLAPYAALLEANKENDGIEGAAVLAGCLNRALWNALTANKNIKGLLFENLCQDPINRFRELYGALSLPYDSKVESAHIELCFKSSSKTENLRAHEIRRNSADMAWKWRETLSEIQVAQVKAIWDNFDIPLYINSSDWTIKWP